MVHRGFWRARETSTYRPAPAFRSLRVETLEDRRLLDAGGHSIELFETSPALFVEDQGQWDDDSARYLFQGSDANVLAGDGGVEEVAETWFGPPEALTTDAGSDFGDDRQSQVTTEGLDGLATSLAPGSEVYVLDDGTHEDSAGFYGDGDMLWLNAFDVQQDVEWITSIALAWGHIAAGFSATVLLYEDPNDDGNPSDAVLLTTADTVTAYPETDLFTTVAITPTQVSGKFFVGALFRYLQVGPTYPASIDTTSPAGKSWVVTHDTPGGLDIDDLMNNYNPPALVEDWGFSGNWLLRADGPRLPDIVLNDLDWSSGYDRIDFTYAVKWHPLTQDTQARFYWARGETFPDEKLAEIVLPTPIILQRDVNEQGYPPIHVSRSDLGIPPESATHLLCVLDPWDDQNPNGVIEEEKDTENNVKALPVPTDIKIVDATTSGSEAFRLFAIEYQVLHGDSAPFDFHAWISTDSVFNPTPPGGGGDQPLFGTRRIDESAQLQASAGIIWSVILELTVPQRPVSEQERFVFIVADGSEEVNEFNEENNSVFVIPLFRNREKMNRIGTGPKSGLKESLSDSSGPLPAPINRGTLEFNNLVRLDRDGVWEPPTLFDFRFHNSREPTEEFKNEDRLAQYSLLEPTSNLAGLIREDKVRRPDLWAGYEFSINEAYDSTGAHDNTSRHYSGNALDLGLRRPGQNSVPPNISRHLSRLAGLAWLAGFDWVNAEITKNHVHVSERPVAVTPPPGDFQLQLNSPADLLLVDPNGNRSGVDPATGETLLEIPGTVFSGAGTHPQTLTIQSAPDGVYDVHVVGNGTGTFTLDFVMADTAAELARTQTRSTISVGTVINYTFDFARDSAAAMRVLGDGNLPPVAYGDLGFTYQRIPVVIDVLENDSDPDQSLNPTTVGIELPPSHGEITVSSQTGQITYVPEWGFAGSDVFKYTVADNQGAVSGEGIVMVEVSPNHVPIARLDEYDVAEDGSLEIKAPGVVTNDSDADGDDLLASVVAEPSDGELEMGPDGSFVYTPHGNFSGTDSFTYTVNDWAVDSSPATVTIDVYPVYDGLLGGTVFNDLNGDGIYDATEPGMEGWTVERQKIGEGRLLETVLDPSLPDYDFFGGAVAALGDNLLVGAPRDDTIAEDAGVAYLYDRTTTSILQTFLNPSGAMGDQFGHSLVAVGDNVLIGAPYNDTVGWDAGAAYLFDSATGNLLQTYLLPFPDSGAMFGYAVAAVGDNILIGAPNADGVYLNAGAVYLFDGSTGNLLQTFVNPTPDRGFGSSLGVSGTNILVGAPHDNTAGVDAGAAYLFDGTTGDLLETFLNPAPAVMDRFGHSVAGVGSNVLIGAPSFDDEGTGDAGAAYLFNVSTGALLREFLNPSPDAGDGFGFSVNAAGNNVLIGAPYDDSVDDAAGAVYLFNSSTGQLLREFTGDVFSGDNVAGDNFGFDAIALGNDIAVGVPNGGENRGRAFLFDGTTGDWLEWFRNPTALEGDRFGSSVAAVGNNVLVGAIFDDTAGEGAGAAYLFDGSTGDLLQTLLNPFPDANPTGVASSFGYSVAGVGNNVVVGAPYDYTAGGAAGAAHLFDGSTGDLIRTLFSPSPGFGDHFGYAVASLGSDILVGAPGKNVGASRAGAAYRFDASTGDLLQTFLNPDPDEYDYFGRSIAVVGDNVLIGAPYKDVPDPNAPGGVIEMAGAAYLFDGVTGNLLHTFVNPASGWYAKRYGQFGSSLAGIDSSVVIAAPGYRVWMGEAYVFDAVSGELRYTLSNPSQAYLEYFGASVAAQGGQILVGAPANSFSEFPGIAYSFDVATGELLQTFLNPTPAPADIFGDSITAIENKVIIGASDDDTGASNAGSVYWFDNGHSLETTDANGDYSFTAFEHATYRVRQIVQDGFVQTFPGNGGTHGVAVASDADLPGYDFGLQPRPELITVTPVSGLETTEAGGTAQFTVVLASEPTADVTIGLSSTDTTEGTVSPAELTFTAANWNTAQTVTITGVDDELDDGDVAYTVQTAAATSADANYNGLDAPDVSVTNSDDDPAQVTARHVFYNNSSFDGNDPAANATDDNAIATDKTPLRPGRTATFANYTSYSRGINGIMVDIANLANPAGIDAGDFVFRVGNDSAPGGWPAAPAPTSVGVRAGAGEGGSDRVTIIWADNAIEQEWLQVTVLANADTGLVQNHVFYAGNLSGDTDGNFVVNIGDMYAVYLAMGPGATINNPADIDRNGVVNIADMYAVYLNLNSTLEELTAPAAIPQSIDSVFDENPSWAIELMWLDELYGTSDDSEEEEDDALGATDVDGVSAVYYDQ